jgi:putative ABC transport system ATP-binding protein
MAVKTEVIKANNVIKTYQMGETTVTALNGVSLNVNKGEIIMILGPSGSGKSTLLHIMGALDHPTQGEVYIKGKLISDLDDFSLAIFRRYYLGFIFQSFNLIPTLNVFENVLVPTIPDGHGEDKHNRAKALLELVGLSHRLNHKPAELSGGERQRVSIARALINDPEIIFADEPTGNLDSKTGQSIIDLILKLRKEEKKTFIIVTHDPSLTKYADKLFYIKDGKISDIKRRS